MNENEKIMKIVDIFCKYKDDTKKFKIKIDKKGVGIGFHKDVHNEIRNLGIENNELSRYIQKILDVLRDKIIEDKQPENEVEEYIIEKLYNEEFKEEYLFVSTQIAPIFNKIEVVEVDKKMGDNTVKSYIVKIYLTDINGNPKLYEFECSEKGIKNMMDSLSNL
jgi:hypothetical protein